MLFSEVIGQLEAKRVLKGMVEHDRLPHALLMLASPGSGGLPLALAFTQYVLCTDRTPEHSACGTCAACQKVSKWVHPDVHFSYPTVGSKVISTHFLKEWRAALAQNAYLNVNQWLEKLGAENKQGNIPVAECSDILRKLSLKTFEGKYKILVMWLPEFLGKEGNRLLKLIEEPPENTLFILVAENAELILNTVLSRCQLVKLAPLTDAEIADALSARAGVSAEKALATAQLSYGNFNMAQVLVQQDEDDNALSFLEWMRIGYAGNGVHVLNWVEETAKKGRERQKLLLQYGLHFLREMMVLSYGGTPRLQEKELQVAEKMKNIVDFEKTQKLSDLFDESIFHIERNANPRILFLRNSLKLHKILKGIST
jgi:DNA polymerase III subunit delta'